MALSGGILPHPLKVGSAMHALGTIESDIVAGHPITQVLLSATHKGMLATRSKNCFQNVRNAGWSTRTSRLNVSGQPDFDPGPWFQGQSSAYEIETIRLISYHDGILSLGHKHFKRPRPQPCKPLGLGRFD